MRNLPSDFIAAINADDAPVSMLVLKLESGDIKFSDGMYGEGLPYIESISEEQDGGSFENYLSRGNLETCKLSVTLIYSDLSKSTIHSVISELQSMSAGNLRCRAELWKKFVDIDGNDTCLPLLWNVYAVQDNSENFACREDQMLFPLELITLPGSENRKLSITNDPEKSYDYVIGKAEGLPLQLMEEESSKWTELIGDKDGEKVEQGYTGLIRVEDATKLNPGQHLINGEEVTLARVTAGYMEITARATGGTEAQEHESGSRIFPLGAVFRYACCAGPVGSFEKLRTSNEIDIYDEDGDLDVTEYRDLYSGGNEELHPELNPAQIWFNDRMPWLRKDQNFDIEGRVFYGNSFLYSDDKDVVSPEGINTEAGKPAIKIDFQRFSEESNDYWYKNTDLCLPGLANDTTDLGTSTYQESGFGNGYFEISQSTGEYIDNMSSTAYRQILIKDTCPQDAECWTSTAPVLPPQGWYNYTVDGHYYGITFQRVYTERAGIRVRVVMVRPDGSEELLNLTQNAVSLLFFYGVDVVSAFKFDLFFPGHLSPQKEWFPTGLSLSNIIDFDNPATIDFEPPESVRLKMYVKMEYKNSVLDPTAWGFIRIGGKSIYSNRFHYGMATFWRYYDNNPSAWISSSFGRDKSSLGIFDKAKVRLKGVVRNTNDFADGIVTIYENAITDNFISGATYTAATGEIDLSGEAVGGLIQDGEPVAFINTGSDEWDKKNFILTVTATPGIFTVDPPPSSDHTFAGSSNLIRGAWKSLELSDGNRFDTELTLIAGSWGDLAASKVTIKVALGYLVDQTNGNEGKERISGHAGIELDGGIEWLLSYTATNLDGLQVSYTDTLYVDAVSTRGQDWTPARAVQYIAADHTSWPGLIDTANFDARHAEFVAAGHYLNGTISGSSGSQDAIRTVLKEGLAGLNYPLGKITMYSYVTDLAATVPVKSLMSVVRPDRESFPDRGFMQSANEMRSNRMFFRWNKNLSTGKYDGNVIKSDGTVFLNDQVVTFELVKSDIIGNSVANFLYDSWKYGYIIQDCKYPTAALAIEKHDLIESFSMADGDLTADFIVVSCSQTHESAKARRGLSAKIVMIKR